MPMLPSRSIPVLMSAAALALPFSLSQGARVVRAEPGRAERLGARSFVADAVKRSGQAVVTLETQRTVRSAGFPG